MSGLILKLSPKERLLINSAVIENGDRRSRLAILTPQAKVLRLKDAIHPDQANTPVRRVCYAAQLLLSGDADPSEVRLQLMRRIEELTQIFSDSDSQLYLTTAAEALLEDRFYQCLKSLRALLPSEDRLLSRQVN